jgi:hypothetical protein
MATACLMAFFLDGGWLVPIDPSFFQSSTSVLILLLTTAWLDPFLSGTIFLLSAESIGRVFNQSRRSTGIEVSPITVAPFAFGLFDICRPLVLEIANHALLEGRVSDPNCQDYAGWPTSGFSAALMIVSKAV